MIKRFFHQDSIAVGIIATLGSELIGIGIIIAVMAIAHLSIMEHLQWFAVAFIPTLFVMRHYMKLKEYLVTTKSIIITIFITFIAFMFFMLRHNINV